MMGMQETYPIGQPVQMASWDTTVIAPEGIYLTGVRARIVVPRQWVRMLLRLMRVPMTIEVEWMEEPCP